MEEDRRVAVVTGAGRPWSLGRAAALEMARRGHDVAVVDIRDDWGADAVDRLSELGARGLYVNADVSSKEAVTAMAARVGKTFGRVDALLNVAGVASKASTETFSEAEFHRVININLLGSMLCAQAVLPFMKSRGYGRIVNVASTAPYCPPPAGISPSAVYNASKGGVVAWTKSAAAELAKYGIVTTVVAVGGVSTRMGADTGPDAALDEHMLHNVYRDLPWGRLTTAEETAEVLADVACARNHLLLGGTIHAHGGRVISI